MCCYRINSHYPGGELIFEWCLLIPRTKLTADESPALVQVEGIGWMNAELEVAGRESRGHRRSRVIGSFIFLLGTHIGSLWSSPRIGINKRSLINDLPIHAVLCCVAAPQGRRAVGQRDAMRWDADERDWWRGGVIVWESEDVRLKKKTSKRKIWLWHLKFIMEFFKSECHFLQIRALNILYNALADTVDSACSI